MPHKCKDPGMFTIPYTIGSSRFDNALIDLGASIIVMPNYVYLSLGLGPLQATRVMIQLANRSNVFPAGVLEDVLVKVDELIFPADFYILEMEGESSASRALIILGRPFLKTAGMKIDVKADTLSMEFGDDMVHFNLDDAMKPPQEEKSVCHVDVIEEVIDNSFTTLYSEFSDLLHSNYALTSYSCSCTDTASYSACLEIS